MSSKKLNQRAKVNKNRKRGWRAYQLAQRIIECIQEGDAKRVGSAWFGQRVLGELAVFSAIGDPIKSGHPSFVAARVDYRGKTVLDTVYDEHTHDVRTFEPGVWERRLIQAAKTAGAL